MLSADTITDDQIRALRVDLRRLVRQIGDLDELAHDEALADEHTCTIALTDRRAMAYMIPGVAEGVRAARARCAQILNQRASAKETR